MHRKFRKPLIIMTPKSLLRHKKCVSGLEEFGPGSQFHRVLWDDAQTGTFSDTRLEKDSDIKRVIACTGKVYFDLLEERDVRRQTDTYILRLEQLFPFPERAFAKEMARFTGVETVVWCQEEPRNQGTWHYINEPIEEVLVDLNLKAKRPVYAGRSASASTATGLASRHAAQQDALVDQALTIK
jgi:2-oxoglutarate dehydrogenase E1 component